MQLLNKKIAYLGLLTSISILFGYIEGLFMVPVGIPGVRIGIGNIVTVIVMYMFGALNAFTVMFIRVLVSGLLFGNGTSIIYSACGALLSYLSMLLVYKTGRLSIVGVSVIGGVMHNAGQLIIAAVLVGTTSVFYYLPVLSIAGIVAGAIVGIVASAVIKRLSHFDFRKG